jgi:hypothetical protein
MIGSADFGTLAAAFHFPNQVLICNQGVPYAVDGYPKANNPATNLPWEPATDSLHNLVGRVNYDNRTVTLWAITSTISGKGIPVRTPIDWSSSPTLWTTPTPPLLRMRSSLRRTKLNSKRSCAAFLSLRESISEGANEKGVSGCRPGDVTGDPVARLFGKKVEVRWKIKAECEASRAGSLLSTWSLSNDLDAPPPQIWLSPGAATQINTASNT